MTINITTLQNADSVWDLASFANTSAEGFLFGLIIIAIFFILTMRLNNTHGFINAIMTSSFACLLLSIILVYIEVLSFMFPLAFIASLAFGSMFKYMNS